MKIVLCLLLITLTSLCSAEQKASIPFDITTSSSLVPLEAQVVLKPKDIVKDLGVKTIKAGVKFPDCSNKFVFYLDLTAWSGSIAKVHTHSISIKTPRVCLSDLPGVSLPGISACFVVRDLYLYKGSASGKIYADLSVGFVGIQFGDENILLHTFLMGDMSNNLCAKEKTQSSCAAVTKQKCGWCQETNECFEVGSDGRSDACQFCPRCTFVIATAADEMKTECESKPTCGWCSSNKKCLAGDDIGPHDPDEKCDSTKWEFNVTTQVYPNPEYAAPGSVSSGTAAFLSFFLLGLGLFFGFVVGPIATILTGFSIYKYSNPTVPHDTKVVPAVKVTK
eukprot:gene10939-3645_t